MYARKEECSGLDSRCSEDGRCVYADGGTAVWTYPTANQGSNVQRVPSHDVYERCILIEEIQNSSAKYFQNCYTCCPRQINDRRGSILLSVSMLVGIYHASDSAGTCRRVIGQIHGCLNERCIDSHEWCCLHVAQVPKNDQSILNDIEPSYGPDIMMPLWNR